MDGASPIGSTLGQMILPVVGLGGSETVGGMDGAGGGATGGIGDGGGAFCAKMGGTKGSSAVGICGIIGRIVGGGACGIGVGVGRGVGSGAGTGGGVGRGSMARGSIGGRGVQAGGGVL